MTRIEEIGPTDFRIWDEFVENMDEASFHHQIRWREFVERLYGKWLTPVYLMALDGDEIQGVLPLFVFRHRFFGKKMISLPFSTRAGCCCRNDLAEELLIRRAIDLTNKLNLDYLEIRSTRGNRMSELVSDRSYFTLRLNLEGDFEKLQQKFRSTTRRYIRRSQENELSIDMSSDDIEGFYRIYALGQRNLGTPTMGFKWLETFCSYFEKNPEIVQVRYNNEIIAAALFRIYKDGVTYVIGSSLPEYRNLYPNYYLFATMLKHYCENGYKFFDLGRSIEQSGSYFFKVGWGAQPVQLHYQYYLRNNKTIPSTSQASSKRKLLAKLWKRMPLSLAEQIGPIIRRYYP